MRTSFVTCVVMTCLAVAAFVIVSSTQVEAHCQVPCGIYDDHARIHLMLEDVTTITKAVTQIEELSKKMDAQNLNQATRWIATKEEHASRIISTVSEYFLTQKVKDVAPGAGDYQDYLGKLAIHHRVMRAAMKTKQTVSLDAANALKAAVEELGKLYPGK